MKKIMRRVLACSGCILLSVTGCLQTPDMEYVANKEGQSTLISDNTIKVDGSSIAEQIMAPARAEAICEKVNEYTSIKIDADIILPEGNAVPIYSVTPMKATEDTLEDFTSVLYDTDEFHDMVDGEYADYTDEDIYQQIEKYTKILHSAQISDVAEPVFNDNGDIIEMNESLKEEFGGYLEELKLELIEREERPDYGDSVHYEFESKTKTYTDYNDSNICMDYVYETAAYTGMQSNGNEYDLRIIRDGINTEFRFARRIGMDLKFGHMEKELSAQSCYRGENSRNLNQCSYSSTEAVELCRDFLMKLGLDHMDVVRIEDLDYYYKGIYLGPEGYVLYFNWSDREIQDAFTSDSYSFSLPAVRGAYPLLASQMQDEFWNEGDEFVLNLFPTFAVFSVTNNGLESAWIQNPLIVQGQLAENVKLLAFDQVLQLGVSKLEALYGDSGRPERYCSVDIEIGTIELNYARMQSPDSKDSYTIIPVWDFRNEENGQIMLTLNAIDGSIFDRKQGY